MMWMLRAEKQDEAGREINSLVMAGSPHPPGL